MLLKPLRSVSGDLLRLDFLRFVASAGIVWHHSHEYLFPPAIREEAMRRCSR